MADNVVPARQKPGRPDRASDPGRNRSPRTSSRALLGDAHEPHHRARRAGIPAARNTEREAHSHRVRAARDERRADASARAREIRAGRARGGAAAVVRRCLRPCGGLDGAEIAVHMLDYIAVDYPEFVRDGRVLDEAEYTEQREFAAEVIERLRALPDRSGKSRLLRDAERLRARVDAKAPGPEISALAAALRWAVIRAYDLVVAPSEVRTSSGRPRSIPATARVATAPGVVATDRRRPAWIRPRATFTTKRAWRAAACTACTPPSR